MELEADHSPPCITYTPPTTIHNVMLEHGDNFTFTLFDPRDMSSRLVFLARETQRVQAYTGER
jgi:hypothetical protein